MTDLASSPLQEIQPGAIDELFARDPLELTDAEFSALILALRKERENYLQAESAGKRVAKPKASTLPPVKGIEDLGL